ncbi:armadillo repeat protein [Xylariaceae sp. FL0016]|nr:armadillo repeat protein [Xylariaceae sp. FL0016]
MPDSCTCRAGKVWQGSQIPSLAMELDSRAILAQLNSASTSDRIAALRYLKNHVVGDLQRKEAWVRCGIIPPIVAILAESSPELNGKDLRQSFSSLHDLSDQETVKLQALQLIASFASAGPSFLRPLHYSGAVVAVVGNSCLRNERPEIVSAVLQVLRDITKASLLVSSSSPITADTVADLIFASRHLEYLSSLLSQPSANRGGEAQASTVAYLVKTLCREERHQTALVNSGILDALATRLAGFVVAEGLVLPRAEILARAEGLADYIPEAATSSGNLEDIIGAIVAIVTDSPYRACKLLYSPSILAVFPNVDVDLSKYSRTPPESIELPGLRPTKQKDSYFMDLLLPDAPDRPRGFANHAAFPPLGIPNARESLNGRPTSKLHSSHVSWTPPEETLIQDGGSSAEDAESPLIPWLINLVRTRLGSEALMAASLLISLFKTGFAYSSRESVLALLVVPVLLGMLKDVEAKTDDFINIRYDTKSKLHIIEETPAVLARLVTDSPLLQTAACDCDAVKAISKLLKSSYDAPAAPPQSRPWSPEEVDSIVDEDLPEGCQLGEEGRHHQSVHRIRVREHALKALGALSLAKEEYRKAIIDQDTIPYIVESLQQFPVSPKKPRDQGKSNNNSQILTGNKAPSEENSTAVMIAACYALRMLSRSVNIIRTTLVDHGVARPLFDLLRHPEIDVQIATTAVICNLVPDFSPMREPLVDAGILKVLCEHAHSTNPELRENALWALKHLVDFSSVELKKRCVEELESGWLVQLICDDTEDEALFSAKTRMDRQAAQSALDDLDEDMDMGSVNDQNRPWLPPSFYKSPARNLTDIRILRLAETRLSALHEAEGNPVRKARKDDLAIQEQGLGFIRNLIGGAHSHGSVESANDTTEMIDYLFTTIGQDRLFEILASKLKVKVLHPLSRRGASGNETRMVPPNPKIIEAVIYILVHIAASIPRHRQLVIAQTDLLKQLSKLFTSKDREVRVALCHLINNLTWQDDTTDAKACSQRADELRRLGFLSRLESLGQSDDELDVRERAKSALWQMKHGH